MSTYFSENSNFENAYFYCDSCDYKCSRPHHWKQHIFTKKHQKRIFNAVDYSVNDTEKNIFECG